MMYPVLCSRQSSDVGFPHEPMHRRADRVYFAGTDRGDLTRVAAESGPFPMELGLLHPRKPPRGARGADNQHLARYTDCFVSHSDRSAGHCLSIWADRWNCS